MVSSTPTLRQTPDSSGVPEWLRWAGFRFDPFGPLDAAADPHLSEYMVGHEVFARVWGDGISWAFAPAGGGKTALRISVMQACWVGQETNRPFPIPYVPPFLAWGHARPSEEEHLAAIARAGAIALFLTMAYRPHWFLRMDKPERQHTAEMFRWNLPGPLSVYLERCRLRGDPQVLSDVLDPAFVLRHSPNPEVLREWCDVVEAASRETPAPSPLERWSLLKELLLEIIGFPALYILLDGLDGAPETISNPVAVADCLAPLLRLTEGWAKEKVFLKAFLPGEMQISLVERFPDLFGPAYISTIHWTPDLLAEVIRRRVYVATEGAFGSLDALSSPALRDVETLLAKTVIPPTPREMLVLTRRMLEEHVRISGSNGLIGEEDVENAIRWYLSTVRYHDKV